MILKIFKNDDGTRSVMAKPNLQGEGVTRVIANIEKKDVKDAVAQLTGEMGRLRQEYLDRVRAAPV